MYDSFFVLNHILINPNIYIIIMTFIKWPLLLYNSLHIPFWMTVWANHPQLKMVKICSFLVWFMYGSKFTLWEHIFQPTLKAFLLVLKLHKTMWSFLVALSACGLGIAEPPKIGNHCITDACSMLMLLEFCALCWLRFKKLNCPQQRHGQITSQSRVVFFNFHF